MNTKDRLIVSNCLNLKIKKYKNKIAYFEKQIDKLYDLQDKILPLDENIKEI